MERLNETETGDSLKSYVAPSLFLFSLSADDILQTSLEQTDSSVGDLWNWNDLF